MLTEKGKALNKWIPSVDYQSSYDRIFGKKEMSKDVDDGDTSNSETDADEMVDILIKD